MHRAKHLLLIGFLLVFSPAVRSAEKLEYNRDVRPILMENCFSCHGPDSASRKAGLRLDLREEAIQAGALLPGKPDDSPLIERVFSKDARQLMPPAKSHKKLTGLQKEILRRWVSEGAEYQLHWSFLTPRRPELPRVKQADWVRNPIDRFILAELEKKGLTPAPEADRRTLARRLSLDLIGLPPEPHEVEAFVNDASADAYEKYVDHLMRSPHWGEHRGRYWLDAARYGDTHGIHFDNFREMWAYRDWVIAAFNRNQPFDQFTIEQLAGDLLPNRTLDQQVATGFNRCNITTNEGGVIAEEYLVLYTRDRTETVAQVWLGLTANCAVCHSHKYDPISMKDFYSMSAFFNHTTQGAMDGNIRDTPPIVFVPKPEDRPRYDNLVRQLAGLRSKLDERRKIARREFEVWLKTAMPNEAAAQLPSAGLKLHAPLEEGQGTEVHLDVAGKKVPVKLASGFEWIEAKPHAKAFSLKPGPAITVPEAGDFDHEQRFTVSGWVRTGRRGNTGAIVSRMDTSQAFRGWDLWLENDRVGMHLVHQWPDNAIKVLSKTVLQPNQWYHVAAVYNGTGKAAGVQVYLNGVLQPTEVLADKLQGSLRTGSALRIGQRDTGSRLDKVQLRDVRLFDQALTSTQADQLAKYHRADELLARPAGKRTPQETNELFDWWLIARDADTARLSAEIAPLAQEEAAIKGRGTIAHVMQEKPGEPTAYILFRGEYDQRREAVKAATPQVLPPMPADLPRNRLGFAQWLLRPEHPLTARVTVNRFWQEIFGTGLVRTTSDFGAAGEPPSHPELLDWLAVEFREQGWDIQRFFKLLVTSATYRQAQLTTPEKLEKDPHNRYLSRGARYRLDAEMIRDYALAASTLLVRQIGGPSVKPYQPDGVWEAVAMIGSNTRNYKAEGGPNLYRRSMYTFWKRAAPPASMDIFNAPNREFCTTRRDRTNTPLQALVTLNDPQFVEAARFLAERALKEAGPDEASRTDFLARRLLARPFRPEENRVVLASLAELTEYYQKNEADARKLIAVGESKADPSLNPAQLAAWTMLTNELMNLDEVLNK